MFHMNGKMLFLESLLWLLLIHSCKAELISCDEEYENKDDRRPIWNIAHMVNSHTQVKEYLDYGANALEIDVSFGCDGIADSTYHGHPCDCFRHCTKSDNFTKYLEYLRKLTTPDNYKYREELVLFMLDCKVTGLLERSMKRAGEDLAMKLIKHYFRKGRVEPKAYIIISIPDVENFDVVAKSFLRYLRRNNLTHYLSKIGFDISGYEDLDRIKNAYRKLEIKGNAWLSDGITNCGTRTKTRLNESISIRDSSRRISKVYWWTVDYESSMKDVLRLRVDGMITNYPNHLVNVLNNDEFRRYFRLANRYDCPWKTYKYLMRDPYQG